MAVWILRTTWITIAFCGLVFNSALLVRSINDYQFLKKGGKNGLRSYAAITSVLVFVGSAVTQLSFTIVGVVALTQTPVPSDIPATVQQYIIASLFIVASAFTAAMSAVVFYRRVKLVEMIFEDGLHKENSG